MQIAYYLEFFGRVTPLVLTVAVIFTFFIVQGFGRKLDRMSFYLDRIDDHLREITYFIKTYEKEKRENGSRVDDRESENPEEGPSAGQR